MQSRDARGAARWFAWPAAVALILVLLWSSGVRADQVDRLISQLQSSGDYKVRLSAALNLAKIGDRRAIPAFIKALRDKDKTVRGVAAAGLGKLVTASTPADQRRRAMAALRQSASGDANPFVRKQAQKAYDELRNLGGPAVAVASGAVYINIGAMAAEVKNSGELVSLMRQTAQKTFRTQAPRMVIDWPG